MKRLALAILFVSASAHANERDTAISVQAFSLGTGGLAAQLERQVAPAWSLAAGLGARASAGDDYSSLSFALSGEARWWWRKRFSGPFFGGRAALGRTTVDDDVTDRRIGDTITLSLGVHLGWRWTYHRIELTPSIGATWEAQVDARDRLPPWSRAVPSVGMTIGWLF